METLVGTAVIGIILSLSLAGIHRVRQSAQTMQCTENLRQIGLAYQSFLDKNQGDFRAFKGNSSWVANLRPYLGDGKDAFLCPKYDRIGEGGDVPKAAIRVREIGVLAAEYGSSHDIPISKNGTRMRLSSRYPSSDDDYYLETEDLFDWDWRDLDLHVESLDGGEFRVTAVAAGVIRYTYDFIGPDGSVLVSNYSPRNPGHTVAVVPGGIAYGVSSQAGFLAEGDAQKVLVVEYSQPVANVFGYQCRDFWPTAAAPRHNGSLNVLFRNGSVQRFTPASLDPRDNSIYQRHWLPAAPGPLY